MSEPHDSPDSFTLRRVRWEEARTELRAVRQAVFVEEQGVPPELEWYEGDEENDHVLALAADGTPIGTGRVNERGQIGRMAVVRPWRGRGVGSAILKELVSMAREAGLAEAYAHAQTRAMPFYETHGFVAEGPEFLDADILHRLVRRRLDEGGP